MIFKMSPNVPKRPRLSDQPVPTNWFDLPLEMREIVIDKMDPKTRCKFAQCSKLCESEAKKSKKYMNKVLVTRSVHDDEIVDLLFAHAETDEYHFRLEFRDLKTSQTIVVYKECSSSEEVAKWSKIESGKPTDVRMRYLKDYLKNYKNNIRSFHCEDDQISFYDFNIKGLKNLENLAIEDVSCGNEDLIECGFIDMEKLTSIKCLTLPDMEFTFEQFLMLEGEKIVIRSPDFDEDNINKYLKMLKNGEVHDNFESIKMEITCETRVDDIDKIMNGLDGFGFSILDGVLYGFSFFSNKKKNGKFSVYLECNHSISILWRENEPTIQIGTSSDSEDSE